MFLRENPSETFPTFTHSFNFQTDQTPNFDYYFHQPRHYIFWNRKCWLNWLPNSSLMNTRNQWQENPSTVLAMTVTTPPPIQLLTTIQKATIPIITTLLKSQRHPNSNKGRSLAAQLYLAHQPQLHLWHLTIRSNTILLPILPLRTIRQIFCNTAITNSGVAITATYFGRTGIPLPEDQGHWDISRPCELLKKSTTTSHNSLPNVSALVGDLETWHYTPIWNTISDYGCLLSVNPYEQVKEKTVVYTKRLNRASQSQIDSPKELPS